MRLEEAVAYAFDTGGGGVAADGSAGVASGA
jgi:hypothetical protein